MIIHNGMAQQIVHYSDAQTLSYSNAESDILRFAVYVETDYDTDLDGKPDLVKALIQLPRPAAEGEYLAPVIFEARPYIAGMYLYQPTLHEAGTASFDENSLKQMPPKRIPSGSISTLNAALQADPSDWFYKFDGDFFDLQYLGNLTTYDDLLVCGYAVVQSAGLGTWGSEGIECCADPLEAEAFKCIIEWLTGMRNAYSDRTSNLLIAADWSSGKIGMTGRSYAGAMAFEVASTGVTGLETIVPVAGPASWYAYGNSQGISSGLYDSYGYIPTLAATCASRFFADTGEELESRYRSYLSWLRDQEIQLAGDYGQYWADREYSGCSTIKASALIVQGLNDVMVHPDQFDRMRNAFLRSGCEVKALLHQNGHVTPANEQTKTDILIGHHTYTEWLNLWFTHCLLGVENDVSNLPSLCVQSNLDGIFLKSEEWNTDNTFCMEPAQKNEVTIHAANAHMANSALLENTFNGRSGPDRIIWTAHAAGPLTICGTPVLHIRVKTEDTDKKPLMIGAVLVDHAESPFPSFGQAWAEVLDQEVLAENGINRGEGVLPYSLVQWKQTMHNRKIIAYGVMDLHNPDAGYEPESAVSSKPIAKGTWYDYTLYLQPNFYTVLPGHTLEMYIVPFCGFSNDSAFYDTRTEEELTELGFDSKAIIPITRKYSFTVDLSHTCAVFPVAKETLLPLAP